MHFSALIIGAGPAGYCAAISAARHSAQPQSVLLLEAGAQSGRKLMISGSGQCNFTNSLDTEAFLKKLGAYDKYLKPAYYHFDNHALIRLLEDAGCPSVGREDGKVFPSSLDAADIRKAFLSQLHSSGAKIRYNAKIRAITPLAHGFEVMTEDGHSFHAPKVILCTGGASFPDTGSDGKALSLAKALGHHPTPFRPHLCAFRIEGFSKYGACAGIGIKDALAVFISSQSRFDASGDLLITHQGFSGPLILDHSGKMRKGDQITIKWFSDAERLLAERISQNPRQSVINALNKTQLPARLLKAILDMPHLEQTTMSTLKKADRNAIIAKLSGSSYRIASLGTLETAMASAGGIPLKEINTKTMESRLCPGLYFAGEILDYILPSGGFNIQIACSTGWLAGKSAIA